MKLRLVCRGSGPGYWSKPVNPVSSILDILDEEIGAARLFEYVVSGNETRNEQHEHVLGYGISSVLSK